MIVSNKYSSKKKDWSVEMPNAPYSNRYPGKNDNCGYSRNRDINDNMVVGSLCVMANNIPQPLNRYKL